jgi:hypothetical protein
MKTDKNSSLLESIQTDEGIRLREKMKNKSPGGAIIGSSYTLGSDVTGVHVFVIRREGNIEK